MMKVFLSHSSKDKKFVKKISEALISQGYHTWYDDNEILIGDSITTKIDKGLRESDVVLVFLSKNSVESNWFNEEWRAKFFRQVNDGGVYILPLIIEECEIPDLLLDKKYADFTNEDSYETSLSNLLRTLSIINLRNNENAIEKTCKIESVFEHTKELLDELEEEVIILPILGVIPIVNTLKKIKRSGKLVRLESYDKPSIKIRSIYDHTLSVAHLADCLLPIVNCGITIEKRT